MQRGGPRVLAYCMLDTWVLDTEDMPVVVALDASYELVFSKAGFLLLP